MGQSDSEQAERDDVPLSPTTGPILPPGAEERTYHRRESPSQTLETALLQRQSGEIWGGTPRGGNWPTVQAYRDPLPDGVNGIEFVTAVQPNPGGPLYPGAEARWSNPPNSAVQVRGDYAVITARVTRIVHPDQVR